MLPSLPKFLTTLIFGEPYEAKLTSLTFNHPICILALEIQTLQPLTGAEDIEITHSLCDDSNSPNLTWTLAHYTNKKNVFVLRYPILARRLAIIAGFGRGSSSSGLTVLNIDIKECNSQQIFGDPEIEEKEQVKKHCKNHSSVSKEHKHRHKHQHLIKVSDLELDQLLGKNHKFPDLNPTSNKDRDSVENPTADKDKDPDSVEAVFVQCPPGYLGQDCSVPDCSAMSNCSGAGICIGPNVCRCHKNYFGSDCSKCSGWFCNQCDFYCLHGQCDTVTKSCICKPGWSGAACDVCKSGNCWSDPKVKLILPQTAPWTNQNLFLFVFGSDFPRSRDTRYHCFFGNTMTLGNWISSDLVRCAVPERAKPGKFVFNIMPSDSEVYIPNEEGKNVHFTFYVPCEKDKCQGNCLGPICLCNENFFGENCLLKEFPSERRSEKLFNSSITKGTEGEPYVISIPINSTSVIKKIESSINDLVLDPLKHELIWDWPRGSTKPYDIKVTVVDIDINLDVEISGNSSFAEFSTNFDNSSCPKFNIDIIYPKDTVSVNKWDFGENQNLKVEFDFLEKIENSNSVDVLLAIYCGQYDGVSVPLKFFYSNPNSNFVKVIPSSLNFYSNPNFFPQLENVEIEFVNLQNTISEPIFSSTSFLPFYVSSSSPPYLETSNLIKNGSKIRMTLGLNPSFEVNEKVKDGVLKFGNPENPLFTIPYSITPTSTEDLDLIIVVEGLVNMNTTSPIDYPLEVTITGNNGQTEIKRMIYVNVRAEFYPLSPGFYKISIKSSTFESHEEVFKLTRENNLVSIFLEKKKQIIPVFDGNSVFVSEFPIFEDPTIESSGEFSIEPSVFFSSDLNKEIFAKVTFKKGPSGATGVLNFEDQENNSEFLIETERKITETFCLGCGLRTRIKVVRNPLFVSSENPKCNIVILKIPFFYSVEGLKKDFKSFFEIVIDKRSSKNLEAIICETTTLFRDCAAAKLTQCRELYQPAQICGGFWRNIPDDTLSIDVYALFMKLTTSCKMAGIDMRKLQSLIHLGIHLMNTGFSDLKKIKIVEFNPWIFVDKKNPEISKPSSFKVQSTNLDGNFVGFNPDITINELKSGKTALMGINMTTLHNDVAVFKNFSMKVLIDDDLPEYLDFKFFFIREKINKDKFIVSDGGPENYKSSFFHFDFKTSKIENLTKIQILEKIENEESTPNSNFLKVTANFERIMDEEEILNFASPEGLKKNFSTVFGFIDLPGNLETNQKLVRVSEISNAGLRRHFVDLENVWRTQAGQQQVLNFLDTKALPPALAPQLTYEFIFGNPKDFNAPYFSHRNYEIQIVPEMVVQENTVLGRIGAQSPVGEPLNYSLVTKEDIRNFAVNGKTGEIILLTDSLPTPSANESGICTNIIVTDESKRQSIVPFSIRLPNQNSDEIVNCTVFPKGTSINHHVFIGDRSALKMMEFVKFLPTFIPPMISATSTSTEEVRYETTLTTTPTTTTTSSTSIPTTETTVKTTEPWNEDDLLVNLKPTLIAITTEGSFPQPPPFPEVEVTSGKKGNEDILINLITIATPPTTSALPVATGMSLFNKNSPRPGTVKIGQIHAPAGVLTYSGQQSIVGEQTSASIIDTACRLRESKPIWSVVCDMAKTVHFKPM
ncbi:hypothetical protein FO519_007611 [Halicephalobus sp. NKZ332]|nr:hypothetical protein FO519_007611 [Halicephalobus sp. NKZ332]